jgi:hypothetical protein
MLPSFSSAVISLSFTERNRIFHCQNMHWSKHTVSILTSQKRKSNVTTSIRLQGKCLSCENSRSGSFCHYQCPYSWLQLRVAIQNNKEAGILEMENEANEVQRGPQGFLQPTTFPMPVSIP